MEATWKPHPFFSSPRKARVKFWSPYPCNQWEQKRYLPLPLFFCVFSSISCAWLAQLRYASLAIHLEPSSAMNWYNGWVIWALCFEMWSEISELVVETIFCSGNHGIKIPKVEKPHWIAKHLAYRKMFITQSLTTSSCASSSSRGHLSAPLNLVKETSNACSAFWTERIIGAEAPAHGEHRW